ncbi:MAG: hypothetical protein M5R36_05410 [Deltaproteobacteria bacterium]|nr:hypothetical protein [Deltaproteobacteria bacterium]
MAVDVEDPAFRGFRRAKENARHRRDGVVRAGGVEQAGTFEKPEGQRRNREDKHDRRDGE